MIDSMADQESAVGTRPMSRVSLWSRLLDRARRDPEGIAFHFPDLDLPPLNVGRWARAAAALCLKLRNFAATLLADRPLMPLSMHLTHHELRQALKRAGVKFLIGPADRWAALGNEAPPGIKLEQIETEGDPAGPGQVQSLHTGCGRLCLQSSGTTGLPKIVSRSQESLDAVAVNCARAVGFDRGRVLGALPACHSYGVEHLLLAPLVADAEVWMMQRFEPNLALRLLRSQQINLFPGVPFMFDSLVHTAGSGGPLAPLRAAYSAGGPLPEQTRCDFEKTFNVPLGQLYGATEIGSVTYADPADACFDPASVGRPMEGVQIRVTEVDAAAPHPTVPIGVEGQVWVRAPSMLSRYVDDEAEPAVDGFFASGDLGRLDEHGQLTLTGRLKLLIDIGGMKVNLMEVEAVLRQHPLINEAVVVAVPVTETQSRLRAVVEPAAGADLSADQVRAHVRDRLSAYKVPRQIELTEALPRSATGKVLRREI